MAGEAVSQVWIHKGSFMPSKKPHSWSGLPDAIVIVTIKLNQLDQEHRVNDTQKGWWSHILLEASGQKGHGGGISVKLDRNRVEEWDSCIQHAAFPESLVPAPVILRSCHSLSIVLRLAIPHPLTMVLSFFTISSFNVLLGFALFFCRQLSKEKVLGSLMRGKWDVWLGRHLGSLGWTYQRLRKGQLSHKHQQEWEPKWYRLSSSSINY